MKNELMMASLLTVTAGIASQVAVPNYAWARNNRAENKLAKNVLLKITEPARYKDYDGKIHEGHIYLSLTQKHVTPEFPNQLHAEMEGTFFFESDLPDNEVKGHEPYTTFVGLIGVDGSILLDRIDSQKEQGNTYNMYGCSSTSTCDATEFTLNIAADKVVINGTLDARYGIEILKEEVDSVMQTTRQVWTSDLQYISMIQIPVQKD